MPEKILYFEAPDGISGDMTLGALIDLGADAGEIKHELGKFVPEPFDLAAHPFARNGIRGINLDVIVEGDGGSNSGLSDHVHEYDFKAAETVRLGLADHVHEYQFEDRDHHHEHRRYRDITAMIRVSGISERAKRYALNIFSVIADAEAAVHGTCKDEVAFHEVGAMDSIIDIVGTAIAVDLIGAETFFCAALHDGSGQIICRHGLIPVPVPAVMEMAKDARLPIIIDDDVKTEMITPTGFGIVKGLGAVFAPSLGIVPEKVGYGFGKRDTGRLGAVRITLGTAYQEASR